MINLSVRAKLILSTLLLGTFFSMNVNAEKTRIPFTIENGSTRPIVELYTSEADIYNWGGNILGAEVLNPRDVVNIIIDADRVMCMYDFRAVFADGSESVKRGVSVCSNDAYTYTN